MSHVRSGAALIIAISVLAALLLLALPFVFSQTASMAGAQAAAWGGTAGRGRGTAEQTATAAAVYVNAWHLTDVLTTNTPPVQARAYSALPDALAEDGWDGQSDDRRRFAFPTGLARTGETRVPTVGAEIEDEQGKLDANALSPLVWAKVLAAVQVKDPGTLRWAWSTDTGLPLDDIFHWGGWAGRNGAIWRPASMSSPDVFVGDPLDYGRLAIGLTDHRVGLPGARYVAADQLLGAAPDILPIGSGPRDPVLNLPRIQQYIAGWEQEIRDDLKRRVPWRNQPLTRSDLAHLRRHLTFHTLGQARSGVADVGSIIDFSSLGDQAMIHDAPFGLPVANWGFITTVGSDGLPRRSRHYGGFNQGQGAQAEARGSLICVEVPPAVNLNLVEPQKPVALGLFWPQATPPPLPPVYTALDQIPLAMCDPDRGDGTSRMPVPPVDVMSWGVVTVDAGAAVADRADHLQAERRRRSVVQAVPQERAIERRWKTQADYAADLLLKRSSNMVSGPNPVNRVTDLPSTRLADAGWLEPAPLGSFSANPGINANWRATFGLATARPLADVLKAEITGWNLGAAPVAAPDVTVTPSPLGPQGLEVTGTTLAYPLTAADGPLHFTNTPPNTPDVMRPRHLSMRFRVVTFASGPTCLYEARQVALNASRSVPMPASADDQHLLRVEYQPDVSGDGWLVLKIANAAIPLAADTAETMGDEGLDPLHDNRSLAAPTKSVASKPPQWGKDVGVRRFVKGGLITRRWYQLQVVIANDRPGGQVLILDSHVGRDMLAAPGAITSSFNDGDWHAYPALRLDSALLASGSLNPVTITVAAPGGLALPDILPSRGLVRIDDEWIAYDGLGAGELLNCHRGRRQNTNQGTPMAWDENGNGVIDTVNEDTNGNGTLQPVEDINGNGHLDLDERSLPPPAWMQRPTLQTHATGARITPGWAQARLQSGRWWRGAATTTQSISLPGQWPTGTVTVASILPLNTEIRSAATTEFDFVKTPGTDTFPSKGYVRIEYQGGVLVAAYQLDAANTKMTLDWDSTPTGDISGGFFIFGSSPEVKIRLASIAVGNGDAVTDQSFRQTDGLIQVLGADGACEWIGYECVADRTALPAAANRVGGRYFVEKRGFPGSVPPGDALQPWNNSRGRQRTVEQGFASGVTILPVQDTFTSVGQTSRFESGDVLTCVPDTFRVSAVPGPPIKPIAIPVQLVVRHAARDGYPVAGGDRANDTRNELFACLAKIPDALPDPGGHSAVNPIDPVTVADPETASVPMTVLIGRGTSGDDLSPLANAPGRRGYLPRRAGWATQLDDPSAAGARIALGGPDLDRTGPGGGRVVVDDIVTGDIDGTLSDANQQANRAAGIAANPGDCAIVQIGGAYDGVLLASTALPIAVKASQDIFTRQYGLVLLDGEIFAYRRIDPANADLIARGLLGSAVCDHRLTAGSTLVPPNSANSQPSYDVHTILPVLPLPIGPVAEVLAPAGGGPLLPLTADATPIGSRGLGQDIELCDLAYDAHRAIPIPDTYDRRSGGGRPAILRAPVMLLSAADGSQDEVLRMQSAIDMNQAITAPWLRGLYGSDQRMWSAGFALGAHPPWSFPQQPPSGPSVSGPGVNPVAIGLWPRYASPLCDVGLTDANLASQLRFRGIAWASYALRLHGSRFWPADMVGSPPIEFTNPQIDGADAFAVRALAQGAAAGQLADWNLAPSKSIAAASDAFIWPSASSDPPARFGSGTISNEVDGAEVRVHWTVAPTGTTALERYGQTQGLVPRLNAATMRCRAPTRTLAVEDVR